jgi:plastocyanin
MAFSKPASAISLLALALGVSACDQYNGPVIDATGSQCTSGVAQIGVGDGFLEYLCGCTGQPAAGTILYAPANLTCHVPAGTTVYFQYIAITEQHQIVNSSGDFFPSGPFENSPNATPSVATFTATGTYGFEDAYNNALQGSIIVP